MTKKMKVTVTGLICVGVAIAMVAAFFGYQLLKTPVGGGSAEIIFDVAPGSSLSQISMDLQSKGLIRNAKAFQLYAKAKGQAAKFKVGEYSLNQSMTPDEIMAVIVSGKSIARALTVAEGYNLYDIAELFERNKISTKEEFFKLVYDKRLIKSLLNEDLTSLEGYLFPETYMVTKFEGPEAVIRQMVRRFLVVWAELEPQAKGLGWNRNKIVTFASIVEKETGAGSDRPLISSVFHNRLSKNMRLQTDPTILYGMAVKLGKMPNNITKNDLLTPNAYNSYTNAGLPPTPISNPGKEALLAAIRPATTKYLFFVSQNDGRTAFSETIQEHNRAVQQYQLNPKARENKSWRDLKKDN